MSNPKVSNIADTCNQRIRGLNQHMQPTRPVDIDGETMTLPEVIAVYQDCLNARDDLTAKRNATKVALATWTAADAKRKVVDPQLKSWVFGVFGTNSQEAKDMGFVPNKKAVVTTETKYKATLQAGATRKARGTTGKKKKQEIKGTVVVPAEPAAPAATTTAPNGVAASNGVTPSH